ncbi:hypothetical protein BC938DRAFT_483244 [Jimgerdemannia flammicorona]|uniref:Uncharacterized protein n=1 Tax=Jimgerdemannia flammicorona TaxID=994334 RepID=A0A433QCA3_9FUNG|nr:hypothetical protein BC938DRAFT_483244 [Jimgerdemannia flammicorona]
MELARKCPLRGGGAKEETHASWMTNPPKDRSMPASFQAILAAIQATGNKFLATKNSTTEHPTYPPMPLKTTPKQQTFRSHQQPNKRPAPETPRQERRNKTPRTGGWLLELLELFGRTLGAVLTFLWPSRFRFEGGIGKACEQYEACT